MLRKSSNKRSSPYKTLNSDPIHPKNLTQKATVKSIHNLSDKKNAYPAKPARKLLFRCTNRNKVLPEELINTWDCYTVGMTWHVTFKKGTATYGLCFRSGPKSLWIHPEHPSRCLPTSDPSWIIPAPLPENIVVPHFKISFGFYYYITIKPHKSFFGGEDHSSFYT